MDPIADFLTTIRNGYLAKKETVAVPYGKTKKALADILVSRGFIKAVEKSKDGKILSLDLHYLPQGLPVLTEIKRISKPGVRRYVTADALPRTLSGSGLTIISTTKGLMTDKDARTAHLGGEVICQIW